MRIKNTHTKKIVNYDRPSNHERSKIYSNAAYERIFKQGITSGCEALSLAAKDRLYQVFTLTSNRCRKYKKVYAELYPEFMLFEKKFITNGYWWSNDEQGKNERILALLFCAEMAVKP